MACTVVTDRKSDTELEIATTSPSAGFFGHLLLKGHDVALEYRIRAPRNSHLEINHAGYISVAGMTGDINATDRRGDIVLMLPDLAAYTIDAHTKAGLVTSDVAAVTHKKHLVARSSVAATPLSRTSSYSAWASAVLRSKSFRPKL